MTGNSFSISGSIIDIFNRRIFPGTITVTDGKVSGVNETTSAPAQYILPGFIDAHIHIESSMLVPTEFARMAVVHGTVATVSDPHEIANVNGLEGVRYMIDNSKLSPFKFFFGAPSCVPATAFETAGATLDAKSVEMLLQNPDIWYLSEMMNYPGVLGNDPEVMKKIGAAVRIGKPVDGHAPGLRGAAALAYAVAGSQSGEIRITTDHECFTLDEALDKIEAGMHILIREGSAAKNFEALSGLLTSHPHRVMFCSDDKHPDALVIGHINELVRRSLAKGYDLYHTLQAACVNPVLHYNLPVGMLRINDPADFVVVDNLSELNILQTYIDGRLVAENGTTKLPAVIAAPINNFNALKKQADQFKVAAIGSAPVIRVIEAIEGQLVTNQLTYPAKVKDGCIVSDVSRDILKIAVVNRYSNDAPVSVAFIKNFGLLSGAIASTVGHDCHNIIAVGTDDESICAVVNKLIDLQGGIAVATGKDNVLSLPLPVAGLMSLDDGGQVAAGYIQIDRMAKQLGTRLHAPFMTLSFMALLVIPSLKLSDKGLFDGSKFGFTPVQV